MKRFIISIGLILSSAVSAHEMVPTYPVLEPSYLDGLHKTTMTMFNKREDVDFYEIGVFDSEWNSIPFVSNYTIFKIPYLSTVTFDVFIRDIDKNKAVYVCSQSKLKKGTATRTAISSRICSKFKNWKK
tara:strand:+ start:11403 stop:11789 length:387 start_codon:yes stop_codon:yes gene_type:complete